MVSAERVPDAAWRRGARGGSVRCAGRGATARCPVRRAFEAFRPPHPHSPAAAGDHASRWPPPGLSGRLARSTTSSHPVGRTVPRRVPVPSAELTRLSRKPLTEEPPKRSRSSRRVARGPSARWDRGRQRRRAARGGRSPGSRPPPSRPCSPSSSPGRSTGGQDDDGAQSQAARRRRRRATRVRDASRSDDRPRRPVAPSPRRPRCRTTRRWARRSRSARTSRASGKFDAVPGGDKAPGAGQKSTLPRGRREGARAGRRAVRRGRAEDPERRAQLGPQRRPYASSGSPRASPTS